MLSWYMNFISLVGFGAGTLCTLAYLPQAVHSFRTKSVRDISLVMLISLNVGLVLWVAYGFLIGSRPIILPNAITFFLAFPLLVMKLRFHDTARVPASGERNESLPDSH
jgi:MtN3 and saliva related transmembrane protein